MAGKPNKNIKPPPLKPIPVAEDTFWKIMINCVGPLPKSRGGHEFLLTIICATIRYPEAIPLWKINAKSLVNTLVHFFTRYGIPKIEQSNQSSNFKSALFQKAMNELGVYVFCLPPPVSMCPREIPPDL